MLTMFFKRSISSAPLLSNFELKSIPIVCTSSKISKKGRKALVSSEEIFRVLEQYKSEIFDNGVLRGLSHKIWDILSKELKNKVPKKTYISTFIKIDIIIKLI
ncbi:hypothetical protein ACI65C_000191 [Semiaphis heraclei]